jgi:hypothetical protein
MIERTRKGLDLDFAGVLESFQCVFPIPLDVSDLIRERTVRSPVSPGCSQTWSVESRVAKAQSRRFDCLVQFRGPSLTKPFRKLA